ncbi:MAG: metallophosphoesterase [bacterium]
MRVAILSDSHDHVWNLRAAMAALPGVADVILHCGDLCAPFIVPMLAAAGRPVHVVFGNNDADRFRQQALAARSGHVTLHGESALLELGGKRFAMQHFDALARPLAESGRFDVVCYGHDHVRLAERVGACWLLNPGAIMGWRPGVGDVEATFLIYDTETDAPVWWRVSGGKAAAE